MSSRVSPEVSFVETTGSDLWLSGSILFLVPSRSRPGTVLADMLTHVGAILRSPPTYQVRHGLTLEDKNYLDLAIFGSCFCASHACFAVIIVIPSGLRLALVCVLYWLGLV